MPKTQNRQLLSRAIECPMNEMRCKMALRFLHPALISMLTCWSPRLFVPPGTDRSVTSRRHDLAWRAIAAVHAPLG